ncbi:MAG: PDZ domain-containing protein [Eubacteriales bacterium]
MKRKVSVFFSVAVIIMITVSLSGCSKYSEFLPYKAKNPADYEITQKVATEFMNANIAGDVDKAMKNVYEKAQLATDDGDTKGAESIAEFIKVNNQNNSMEILGTEKVSESKIRFTIGNKLPLFEIAGIDILTTLETIEVQDSMVIKWEVKQSYESKEMIEKKALGTIGIEVKENDGKVEISNIYNDAPADVANLKRGDVILAINGIKYENMKYGFEEVPYRLVGEVGSKVTLTIMRKDNTFDVEMTRINAKTIKE